MAAAAPLLPASLPAAQVRAGLALAEAILPGSAIIPAADEATFEATLETLREVHPQAVRMFGAALRAIDASAVAFTGRPFHALGAQKQAELIARWQVDPVLRTPFGLVSLLYKFHHLDRRDIYARLGGKLNVVRDIEQPRWLQQIHRADDWREQDVECDVVVVGTGAGGGVVGRELADRGYAVVFVEEGEHYRRDQFDGRAVSAHTRFYRLAFTLGNAPMPIFIGRLVGGSTAVNGGTCFRTPPEVLEKWCEAIGSDDLSPQAMEPWFQRVEQILEVGPSPHETIGPIADFMARGCDALGWHHFPVNRNAPGCDGKGFCNL
ncbi:MAG TPA: GMC family oxidoreductase N-terminal domain-containing protein, partial [Polyangiaceae bacterium]